MMMTNKLAMTPEEREVDAELRRRCAGSFGATHGGADATGHVAFELTDAMTAAAAEGFVVDVRLQQDEPVTPVATAALYTVRFHPNAIGMFSVSHHGASWRECFVKCFRQADDLAAQALADRSRA